MSKLSRDKGQRGQREVVELLRDIGYEAKNNPYQYRGAEGADVETDFPFYPEVKFQNKLNIFGAIDQVINDNKTGKPYIIFFRKDHKEWHVALKWEDFKEWISTPIIIT